MYSTVTGIRHLNPNNPRTSSCSMSKLIFSYPEYLLQPINDLLQAVLDIPMARDPHIKLPLVVLPQEDDGSTSKERAARPETVNSPEKNSHHYGWK